MKLLFVEVRPNLNHLTWFHLGWQLTNRATSVSVNQVTLGCSSPHLPTRVVYDCSPAAVAGLWSGPVDLLACKGKLFSIWPFAEKDAGFSVGGSF